MAVGLATVMPMTPTPAAASESRDRTSSPRAWSQPFRISQAPLWQGFDVGIGDDGTPAAVWATRNGIRARVRVPGEGWRPTVRLGRGFDPSLSVNDRGGMAATWLKLAPDDEYLLRASRRPAGGPWARPVTLFKGIVAGGTDVPDVSIGPGGKVTVVAAMSPQWPRIPWRPLAFTFADGHWSGAVPLSRRAASDVHVATAPDGRLTAAWLAGSARCAAQGTGASWSRPRCRAKPRTNALALDVDDAGRALLMTGAGVWSAMPGRRWQRESVPGGNLAAFDPWSIAIDASAPGRAAIVWEQGEQVSRTDIDFTMFASVRRLDGTWTRREYLSSRYPGSVGISGAGTSFATWSGRERIRVARKVSGKPWTRGVPVGDRPGGSLIAVNDAGTAILMFHRDSPANLWASWRP